MLGLDYVHGIKVWIEWSLDLLFINLGWVRVANQSAQVACLQP